MRTIFRSLHHRAYLYAIAVLALGLGVWTSVFSLAEAVIFRPLPFPEQQALYVIWKADPKAGVPFLELAYPELKDLQDSVPAIESAALMPTTLYGYGKTLQMGQQAPVQLETAPVSHGFFRTLGVHPMLGHDFTDSDDHAGSAPAAILSYATWISYFHGDRDVVGRRVQLDGEGYTIVGVAGRGTDFPKGVALWTALGRSGETRDRSNYYLQAVVRLRSGFSGEQLTSQVNGLFQRLARQYPQFYSPSQGAVVTALSRYWTGSARPQLLLSFLAASLLFLAACITAGNLFLSKTVARRQEIVTRAALGASPWQIALQLIVEARLQAC